MIDWIDNPWCNFLFVCHKSRAPITQPSQIQLNHQAAVRTTTEAILESFRLVYFRYELWLAISLSPSLRGSLTMPRSKFVTSNHHLLPRGRLGASSTPTPMIQTTTTPAPTRSPVSTSKLPILTYGYESSGPSTMPHPSNIIDQSGSKTTNGYENSEPPSLRNYSNVFDEFDGNTTYGYESSSASTTRMPPNALALSYGNTTLRGPPPPHRLNLAPLSPQLSSASAGTSVWAPTCPSAYGYHSSMFQSPPRLRPQDKV